MHPILLKLGPLTFSTYGLMMATAFIAGIQLAAYRGKKAGLNPQDVFDVCFYILVSSIIGARIFYVAINWKDYQNDLLSMFCVWQGGLVYYGGFIAAAITAIVFLRHKKISLWKMGDAILPSLALGQAIGRWGCFFAGCCYGLPAHDLPWAITFSAPGSFAPKGVPLHPTQIYESLGNLVVFGLLLLVSRYKKFDGAVIVAYFLLYPVNRVLIEQFRGDIERKFLPLSFAPNVFSSGVVVSLLTFMVGLGIYGYLRKKN